MSIADQLSRLKSIRDTISTKLKALDLISSSVSKPNYEDCKNAINSIIDNTGKTSTSNYISGSFYNGYTGYIFGRGLSGYSNESSVVRIPVTNLSSENIKKGVAIGGVVGNYEGAKIFPDTSQIDNMDFYQCYSNWYVGADRNSPYSISIWAMKGLSSNVEDMVVTIRNTTTSNGICIVEGKRFYVSNNLILSETITPTTSGAYPNITYTFKNTYSNKTLTIAVKETVSSFLRFQFKYSAATYATLPVFLYGNCNISTD